MIDLFQDLIEWVVGIWRYDSDLRDNSVFGESEIERRDRRGVAWVCGGTIVVLVIVGVACCWWILKHC